jgi:ribosome biogenesis GTPase
MSDSEAVPLASLGWDEEWAATARAAARKATGLVPGRIARVDFGRVTVLTATETVRATPAPDDQPAAGDWVLLDGEKVHAILPRRSAFIRGDPMEGTALGPQAVAANIDIVLVLQSLASGLNSRRLERELVLAYESGATPVVVLTKADLVESEVIESERALAGEAAPGVTVLVASNATRQGLDDIRVLTRDNRTVALIGASGVGKSTLVNLLVGTDVQETGEVRESDQRGRHTTTARELVLIPGGGVLIDTPGLRAVSLWIADDGLSRAFADVEELAAQCRFSNCSHTLEPGCAVRAAMESGTLDPARFEHYLRLDAELDAAERRRAERVATKAQRRYYRDR